ncbi:MAG: class I SAM-dependent methyltransferase [Saprospiraceae bacterium]|jgi:ubiquinone/menaquinone biosynthesis C-methylase UbiE|nr:class I SAM-dependent methyltransferase [Saprospiraceae bacterium]
MKSVINKIYANTGNDSVLSLIDLSKKHKILDIGCGRGDNAKILNQYGHIIDGITLSEEEAIEAQKYMRNVLIHNLEYGLPQAILSREYDIIICSHVLEHICYPTKVLLDIHRVLKKEGNIIVALPNLMHYKSRIQLLFGNFNYKDTGVWDYTHFRWYTFKTGRNLLEKSGFKVENAEVSGDIPLLTILNFIPSNVRQKIFSLLTFFSKGLFGGQLLYVATKK